MTVPLLKTGNSTRDKILRAALEVFLDVGFDSASIDKIASKAGVTKPTVYSHFGSKIGLLEALAVWQSEEATKHFSLELQSTGNVRKDLNSFSKAFLTNTLSAEALRLHRFAIVEAMTHPELIAPILEKGQLQLSLVLIRYLQSETSAGKLRCPSPELAAQHLMALLIGADFVGIVITQTPLPTPVLKQRIDTALDVFLHYYGVEGN